jgi:hypothetical protein
MTTKSIIHHNLINSPPFICLDNITKNTNVIYLKHLEKKYDDFLDKNHHILLLHDIIEEYLDIRDAITNRISKIIRQTDLKKYYETDKNRKDEPITIIPEVCHYNHSYQQILHPDLRITNAQIKKGYWPLNFEPKEFTCGCTSIKYGVDCDCDCDCEQYNNFSKTCPNELCNSNLCPIIRKHAFCPYHYRLYLKQVNLERQLKMVKKTLSEAKKSKNLNLNGYSKYPWKNL